MTNAEYQDLCEVWSVKRDDLWDMWAGIMAKIHNSWRAPNTPAKTPADFLGKGKKVDPTRKPADPLDPAGGVQTAEEKKYLFRAMLAEAAQKLPPRDAGPREELPEYQRAAVEAAWADFANLTGIGMTAPQ